MTEDESREAVIERLTRDLHDLADTKRELAALIDEIAESIDEGELEPEQAYEEAIDAQAWQLAEALSPAQE